MDWVIQVERLVGGNIDFILIFQLFVVLWEKHVIGIMALEHVALVLLYTSTELVI